MTITQIHYVRVDRWWVVRLVAIISAWTAILLILQLRRFLLLAAQAFDLGIFQQGVWLLANGYSPFVTIRGWHLFADFGLYSGPDLVIHSLTALCVGFGLKELVGKSWWLAGAVMGMATVLTMLLFPIGAHNLPPCHWSALTVLPAGLAGMALKEVMESGGEAKFESGKALKQ